MAVSPSIRPAPASIAAAALLCLLTLARPGAAQSLPPAQPTTQPPPISPAPAPTQPTSHRAAVDYAGGRLLITADNSSLNQILRDIARLTGMTITGGVVDERVFGTYGPADTSTVLSALLNGTGSNMLLIQDAQQSPQRLVLTPRQGGPTPPSPTALREPGESDLPPQLTPHPAGQSQAPAIPAAFTGALPAGPPPAPNPATPEASAPSVAASPTPPPANTTTEQSPNDVKTPQQIYEQLLKMHQQPAKPPQ